MVERRGDAVQMEDGARGIATTGHETDNVAGPHLVVVVGKVASRIQPGGSPPFSSGDRHYRVVPVFSPCAAFGQGPDDGHEYAGPCVCGGASAIYVVPCRQLAEKSGWTRQMKPRETLTSAFPDKYGAMRHRLVLLFRTTVSGACRDVDTTAVPGVYAAALGVCPSSSDAARPRPARPSGNSAGCGRIAWMILGPSALAVIS